MMTPEEFKNFTEITPEMFQRFEDHPKVMAACEQLSKDLAQAISRIGFLWSNHGKTHRFGTQKQEWG